MYIFRIFLLLVLSTAILIHPAIAENDEGDPKEDLKTKIVDINFGLEKRHTAKTNVNGLMLNLPSGYAENVNGLIVGPWICRTESMNALCFGGLVEPWDHDGSSGIIFSLITFTADFTGVSVSGGDYTGRFAGFSPSLLFNAFRGEFKGVSICSVLSWCEKKASGVILTGGFNVVDEMRGVSLSGIYNHNIKAKGICGSLIWNGYERGQGFAFGGLVNSDSTYPKGEGYWKGASFAGIANLADEHSGVQLGLFNRSKKIKGLQIGLINCAENGILPVMPLINFSF